MTKWEMPSTLRMWSAPMNGKSSPSHSFISPCLNLVFDLEIDGLATGQLKRPALETFRLTGNTLNMQ
mgnify:CR=1 FL=1